MLLWSKYLIFDYIDEGIILWSTVNSQGVVVKKAIIGYIDNFGNRIIDKWKEIEWLSCDANIDECRRCNLYPICLGMPCPYYKIKHSKVICNKDDSYIRHMLRSMARQGYIESM